MGELHGDMVVVQSNRLIEAAQTLTLNEKRLILAAAAMHDSRKPIPKDGTVKLHAEDFAEVFGIASRGHLYEALADASQRLYNRSVRTISESTTKRGKRVITDVRWVFMAKYNEGEGTVTLGFSPMIAPYITMLHTEFTRYKLKQIGALGSFYSLRIYEICAQYLKIGRREVRLDDLRTMLDATEKYPDVKDLRRRVLDPAIKDINKHTDLRIQIEPIRKGRLILGFQFTISEEKQAELALEATD
jgi:plasmid replication initiation protein